MAASSESTDYAHRFMSEMESTLGEPTTDIIRNVSELAKRYTQFDFTSVEDLQDSTCHLMVIFLGDNVVTDTLHAVELETALRELAMTVDPAGEIPVICVSTWWADIKVNQVLRKASYRENWSYLNISDIHRISGMTVVGQFENGGVAAHPSDSGMAEISARLMNRVWELGVIPNSVAGRVVGVFPSSEFTRVYPNPANGIVRFEFLEPALSVSLYNNLGQLVLFGEFPVGLAGHYEVNTDELSSGVYYVVAKSRTRTESKRLILIQ